MRKKLLFILALLPLTAAADDLKASFSSDKSYTPYYIQNFDSDSEFGTWTLTTTNRNNTWHTAETLKTGSGNISFSTIDPASKMSLAIDYYNGYMDETITSPAIDIKPNSSVEFYNFFSPVWLFEASWTLYATDVATGDTVQFANQFLWANNSAYDETKWLKFSFGLDRITGKKVTFSLQYKGNGGDTQLIDGFRVVELDDSGNAGISINQGDAVTFDDTSTGNASSWQWEFEGGTPATSNDANPTVTYDEAGTYGVTLTVGDGTATSTVTRAGYVTVKAEQPNAIIGMPAEGYLSPFVATLIPTNVPVTFRDLSTGFPTEWTWTFKGVEPETSNEQNPTVTYTKKGLYSLAMQASNSAGTDQDAMLYAVQAGGAQYVWNIKMDEIPNIGKVNLGFYGNYAGSNWLGLTAFAEHFKKPLAPATIDSVDVYFISNATVSPEADITVSVRTPADNGEPGETLTSTSVKAGDIVCDDENLLPTKFKFTKPAEVNGEFFIVVEGIPNASQEEEPYASDDIAIACVRREKGQPTSTWQLVEDQDEQGNPLGTSRWFENADDPISMVVCPVITYDKPSTPDGITDISSQPDNSSQPVYTLQGVRTSSPTKGQIYIRGGKKYIAR